VSAVILGKRGYHPIGEVMDNEKLIDYIKEAALKALSSLEPAKAACSDIIIPKVKVIGEKRLFALSLLIERSLQRARRVVIPLFGSIGLVLMLFLLLV
jgi:predicted neutral ceramidase superfamily lipid hydrolase